MNLRKFIYVDALSLAAAMSACTRVSPCNADDCPSDVAITTKVRAMLGERTELRLPGAIGVSTRRGIRA